MSKESKIILCYEQQKQKHASWSADHRDKYIQSLEFVKFQNDSLFFSSISTAIFSVSHLVNQFSLKIILSIVNFLVLQKLNYKYCKWRGIISKDSRKNQKHLNKWHLWFIWLQIHFPILQSILVLELGSFDLDVTHLL